MTEPVYFASAADFRAWLDRHAASAAELIVGFHKVGSGVPSMTWPQSVDEALCHGWIDGVRRRVDEARYQIRFTPRRPQSIWSHVNIERVAALSAAGRMTPAGLAAFERRSEARSGVYSHERGKPAEPQLPPELAQRFRHERQAWDWFQAQPPGWRRTTLHWVVSAKQAATRERRLAQLIAAATEGRRL